MGTRGPAPKRSEERLGHPNWAGQMEEITKAPGAAEVKIPPADPKWHQIAIDWYNSLAESGQSRFYEPSDWTYAMATALAITKTFRADKFSAVAFAACCSAMNDLLTTEGARRRVRMELQRPKVDDNNGGDNDTSELDEYRDRLSKRKTG